MKRFWKRNYKWIIPLVVVTAVVSVYLIFYLSGYRFVCYPNLSITWDHSAVIADWISAVAAVSGVIASILAIVYAIQVPKKIAARQDKIAMFEKRFSVFSILWNHQTFSEMLKQCKSENTDQIHKIIESVFNIKYCHEEIKRLVDMSTEAFVQISFLFPDINSSDCTNISIIVGNFFHDNLADGQINLESQNSYISAIQDFWDKYGYIIKNELQLVYDEEKR